MGPPDPQDRVRFELGGPGRVASLDGHQELARTQEASSFLSSGPVDRAQTLPATYRASDE
jgi:hypothetical protein